MGPAAMKKDPFLALFPSSSSSSPPRKTPLPPPPPPPPPHRCPHSPLPPPPPLPLRSSLPPLWGTHSRHCGLIMPPAAGIPAIPSPEASHSMRGDHLVARTRVARPEDCDLAGVPPELLPPKKRVVRHHPYAAAWAIQEMASRHGGRVEEEKDGLRAELLRLRISRPAPVLTKPLTLSDRSRDMARLVLPERLVRASPLLGMLTAAERRLVLGRGGGLPVPAFDRLGRAYRMTLRRDPSARTYLLRGQWTLFVSRHDMRDGDAVQLLAFRPSAWQARLDKHGEGGFGMAMLHCPHQNHCSWTNRERDAADALLLLIAATPSPSSCRLTTTAAAAAGNGFETPVSSQVGVR